MHKDKVQRLKTVYRRYGIRIVSHHGTCWKATMEREILNRKLYPVIWLKDPENVQKNVHLFWRTFPQKLVDKIICKYDHAIFATRYLQYYDHLLDWENTFGCAEKTIQIAFQTIWNRLKTKKKRERLYEAENYWLNNRDNLFCRLEHSDGGGYFVLKLEQYDKNGHCINPVIYQYETCRDTSEELEEAIRFMVYEALQKGIFLDKAIPEKIEPWVLTDSNSFQCRRLISEPERIYELVQINDYRVINQGCRVAHARIYLNDYTQKQLEEYVRFFYHSIEQFQEENGGMDGGLLAEMVFETDAFDYEESVDSEESRKSLQDAIGRVEHLTRLNLRTYGGKAE